MACAVKMLDVGGIGAGKSQLGRLQKILTLPYGARFEQTKLQVEALPPIKYNSNPPSDVIQALVQPTKVFKVSKSATFARD
jgi:hypothetical protein